MKSAEWKKLSLIVFILAALVVMLAPDVDAAGHRVVARVDEPFEVNGRLFPAGAELALREATVYNPSHTLVEAWVGNECLGLIVGAKSALPNDDFQEVMLFVRSPRGHLVLSGFTYARHGIHESYRFHAAQQEATALAMFSH